MSPQQRESQLRTRKTSEMESIWGLKELEREKMMEVARGSGSAEAQGSGSVEAEESEKLEVMEEVDTSIPSSRTQKVGEKW